MIIFMYNQSLLVDEIAREDDNGVRLSIKEIEENISEKKTRICYKVMRKYKGSPSNGQTLYEGDHEKSAIWCFINNSVFR